MMRKLCKSAENCFRLGRALISLPVAAALFFTACSNPASAGDDESPPALGDPRLASLVVEPGNLSPAFCPDKTEYVMNAAHALEDIYIEGKPLETDATVEGGGVRSLVVGKNILRLKVTSSAGLDKTYSITVNRADPYASANAALTSLSIEPGLLDRPFEPQTRQYQAALPNSVDSITVNASAQEAKATVSGAGTRALEVGVNNLEIVVTAPAGNYAVYTLQVRRAGPNAGGSDDAGLASLTLKSEAGELVSFDVTDLNGVYEYNAGVETGAASLEILAASSEAAATFSVDPPEAWSGGEILLHADTTVVSITVTAGDGETRRSYSITIKRPEKSGDSSLAELALEDLSLVPPFEPGVREYAAAAPNSYSRLAITARANHRLAGVTVTGGGDLSVGVNRITITVTPETGQAGTYTIDISRARDSDASLVSLEASVGAFSTAFSANTLEYTLDVPNPDSSVTITATPGSGVAVVDDAAAGESKSYTLNLSPGITAVASFTVTAESGFSKTYRVNAVRRQSGNNKLSALGFTAGTLTGTLEPAFDPNIGSYRALLISAGADSFAVDVTAAAEDSGATVAGTGPRSLESGGNLVQVQVTAANGLERTYTILVICEVGFHIASSLAEMRTFLETQEANTADSPYGILLNGQTGSSAPSPWGSTLGKPGTTKIGGFRDSSNTFSTQGTIYLYEDFKGKYVELDMSGSSGLEKIFHTIRTEATNQAANRALLVSVVLPASLAEIGEYAFAGCGSLKSVTLNYQGKVVDLKQRTQKDSGGSTDPIVIAIPPADLNPVGSTQFAGIPADCVFYVPGDFIQAYKDSPVWSYINDSQFQAIVED
jgi:hypothetical protein